jgi:urease accessory protein
MLASSYAEPPFRVGQPFQTDDGLHLILTSSAPGIFGGDVLAQTIVVERGARVRLTSQSATQVHPAADGTTAALSSAYHVEEGAQLQCAWDPVIPFPRARFDQRIRIELSEGAALFWSDAVISGREARGERWQCDRLAHELTLRRAGALVYLERYAVSPTERAVDAPWLAGDACYFGTTLVVHRAADRSAAEGLQAMVSGLAGVDAAADVIEAHVVLVRLMATSGVAFHAARARIADWHAALQQPHL